MFAGGLLRLLNSPGMAEEEGLLSKKAHLSLGTLYAMPWAPPLSVSWNCVVLYFLRQLKFDV